MAHNIFHLKDGKILFSMSYISYDIVHVKYIISYVIYRVFSPRELSNSKLIFYKITSFLMKYLKRVNAPLITTAIHSLDCHQTEPRLPSVKDNGKWFTILIHDKNGIYEPIFVTLSPTWEFQFCLTFFSCMLDHKVAVK